MMTQDNLSFQKTDVPEVLRKGFLDMQVCVPVEWNDAQVVSFAEQEYPCGTMHGWQIRRNGDLGLNGHPERVSCTGRDGYVHIVVDA